MANSYRLLAISTLPGMLTPLYISFFLPPSIPYTFHIIYKTYPNIAFALHILSWHYYQHLIIVLQKARAVVRSPLLGEAGEALFISAVTIAASILPFQVPNTHSCCGSGVLASD